MYLRSDTRIGSDHNTCTYCRLIFIFESSYVDTCEVCEVECVRDVIL